MRNKKTYQYPWRSNNTFNVLVDGSNYFSSMLNKINQANHTILLEAYLFESGKIATSFINALCEAKKRDVAVHVLLDEYGTKGLNQTDKNKLLHSGIKLQLYNPTSFFHFGRSLKRDHRKLLIIDNKTAFIGGAGFTDEFSPDERKDYWHDVMLSIEGAIVADLTDSFNEQWQKKQTKIYPVAATSTPQDDSARVLISSGPEKNEIVRAIIKHIRNSENHVWLTSPYFISSWKIRRALRFAAKKGVDVRLIFPGPHSDHKWVTYGIQRYYQRLLKANVAVYEYQPRFTHAKVILCDDWFTIGSSNLDRWNQLLNLDANIEVYNDDALKQIIQLFESDFSKSNLVILNEWSSRSLMQHFREGISGVMIKWLALISRKFKR